jgi:soluble lytic murein transglycosylase-like protein
MRVLFSALLLITAVLFPSMSVLDLGFSFRGPVILGLAGVSDNAVVQRGEGEFVELYRFDLELEQKKELRRIAYLKNKSYRRSNKVKLNGAPPFSDIINRISKENGVSPALAAAVIRVESGFKPYARSVRGARGLMQLLPATARKVGVHSDIDDPEQNIIAGVKYLKMMLDRYDGDEKLALAAYNAGPAAVDRHGNVPPYRETIDYVPRVLEYSKEYEKYFEDI